MDALEAIFTRRSVRKFRDKPVPEALIHRALEAAMAAPSAGNAQPWHFVVITDRRLLAYAAEINPYAAMAAEAPVAVVVCGDTTRERSPGSWVVDCAAATENLLLAAHALGLGAVWTSIYPRTERMEDFRRMLGLPEHVVPHSLVPLGFPGEKPGPEERYEPARVHLNRWGG